MELLQFFFGENLFIPHGHCYLWKPALVALHISSDALIALAYYSIPITLVYFVKKCQDLPFNWVFLLFGAFIILCGTTHLIDIWTLWHPIYWAAGAIKAMTAMVSLVTAIVLFPLMPKVMALPSPKQLAEANHKLEAEIVQRQQIEVDLQHSKQMLQLVMDTIPQAIFWKDRNGVFLGCNHSFAKVTEVENPEAIVGKTDWDLPLTPKDIKFYREWDRQVMETDTAHYHVLKAQPQPDGSQAWLDTSKIPLHDRHGNVVGMLGMFEDITERLRSQEALKQAKQELEKSYNLLHSVIEGTPDPIFVKDLEGRHIMVNSAGARTLGKTVEEIIGNDIFAIQPPELATPIWNIDSRIVETGNTEGLEEVIFDGKERRTYLCTKSAYRDSKGEIIGSISIARDISDRKRVEAALAQEREFLNALLDNLSEGIVACDENGIVTLLNSTMRAFHGLPESSIPVHEWTEYFDLYDSDGELLMSTEDIHLYRALQGEKVSNLEMVIAPKNDRTRILLANGQTIVDANGNKLGAVVALHDISDRKRVEEQLRRSEARFRNQAKREQLLNRLASEIRASLDLDTILESAVSEIRQLFAIDRCIFSWYRLEDGDRYWEIVQDDRSPNLASLLGSRIPIADTDALAERLLDCQLLQWDEVTSLNDPLGEKLLNSSGIAALLALPVPTNYGQMGAIFCIRTDAAQAWKNSEVELLQAVTVQLAIAIDQAELYKQSRTAATLAETKARELEQTLKELQQTQAQLVHSEKMSSLGQLVGGIAHEINNPVSFIYGNITHAKDYVKELLKLIDLYQQVYPEPAPEIQEELEGIELEFLTEDLVKLLDSMNAGAERIGAIVHSLRTFSRLDESELKWADIHDGIDSTLLILQNRLNATDARPAIAVLKNYGDLPQVECYPGQLNQVFMNILVNAIDAFESILPNHSSLFPCSDLPTNKEQMTPDRGQKTISISTQIQNNRIFISIVDSGRGMNETVKNRVFDPFFTTKPVGHGTGLGMSIAYQIVKKHGGELTCISTPGKGSEFKIDIPIVQEKQQVRWASMERV